MLRQAAPALSASAARIPRIEGKINELLKLVELTERADEPVKTYSGGMKRRLSIGRVLLTDPKILLLNQRCELIICNFRASI